MRFHVASFVLFLPLLLTAELSAERAQALASEAPPLAAAPAEPSLAFEAERAFFLKGTPSELSRALGKFVAAGAPGVAEAARMIASQPDAALRDQHQRSLRGRVQRELGTLISGDELETAQALLEALAAGGHDDALRELASFLALSGRSKTAIVDPLLEPLRLRASADPLAALRALSRLPEASEQSRELRMALAFDLEDWSALGALALQRAQAGGEAQVSDMGLAAAAFRSASDARRAGDCDERLGLLTANPGAASNEAAVSLLLNGRDEEALPLLMAAGEQDAVFNMLAAEWRYREALALAEKARADASLTAAARVKLEARVAQLLSSLGDEAGAREAVRRHAAASSAESKGTEATAATLGLELRLGMDQAARARAASALDALAEGEHPRSLLGALFRGSQGEAELIWSFLSERHQGDSSAERLARCAALLEVGTADPEELAALHERERARASELEPPDRARWYRSLAALAERHGDEGLALELAAEWNRAEEQQGARNELAEREARAGDWSAAAEAWLEAFRAQPGEPGPLALAGWALIESGRSEAGEELKRQACLIASGDGGRRYRLAGLYEKHGLFQDAARERRILLRTEFPSSWAFGATLRLLTGEASCSGATADAAQWSVPTQLQAFLDDGTTSPGLANHWARRARESQVSLAAERGDASGAFALSGGGLGPFLRDLDLTAETLAGLDEAGFVSEAEELSWRLLDRLREVARDFPASAPHAHAHAALALRTGRDLDAALLFAERAVTLRPEACSYRSTWAELLFESGDVDGARAAIDTVLEHCAGKESYQKQAARYGAGSETSSPVAGSD